MNAASTADVAIIGAGPIGSYAAWMLSRRGLSVIIMEEHPEAGRPEQCAGLVNRTMFDLPGLERLLDSVRLNEIIGADIYSPGGNSLALRAGKVKAISMDRARFDKQLLRNAANAGAETMLSTKAIGIERKDNDRFRVNYRGISGKGIVDTRMLIGCDGASSSIRKHLSLERPLSTLPGVAFQVEIDNGKVPGDLVAVFTGKDTAKGFFAWAVPAGTDTSMRIGLAAEDGASLNRGWERLKHDRRLFEWLGMDNGMKGLNGSISFNLGTLPIGSPRTIISGSALILGDSAGMAKPTSGGGIYPGLMAVNDLINSIEGSGDISRETLRMFHNSWSSGYGKELSRSRFFRKLISQVEDEEVEDVVKRLSDPQLLEIINSEGDIDHPLRLALLLIKKDPSLLKMIPRFLPHVRNMV
ncbi:MAG: geranylgeranyl reductase family protein [Candidatus Thermoplasmatota archaeon]|nr:geranylgeranyl reductase family protein [Candidatus Thermoplasmatota archaeon]